MVIMKTLYLKVFFAVLSFCAFTSCKPKYTEPVLTTGDADFTRFVMIGDGFSAGYMDDAMYHEGQKSGLAELLANQFKTVGSSTFSTRFINPNSLGSNKNGQARLILGYSDDCNGVSSLSPVRAATVGDLNIITTFTFSGDALYSNLTIPGMGIMNVLAPNYAQFNPFYAWVASSETSSVLADAVEQDPTFFGLYLGVEDVMNFARVGGAVNNLPSVEEFAQNYNHIVQQLKANGANGFVATIPDVTAMPYFRTIPFNGLNIQNSSDADLLNLIFGPLGFNFGVGSNPFTIVDPEANDFSVRQIAPGELLLLNIPLDSVRCHRMGSLYPFRNEFVLTAIEQEFLKNTINAYNQVIRNLASTYNLALVETNPIYQKLLSGFMFNGARFSAQFVSGGAYSLDGIHLNPKGSAILANEFIKTINAHFKAKLPLYNPGNFNGVLFP